jgi:NagD protein
VDPYFVGKPNPLMIRSALNALDAHSEQTAMVGDRMDTDIVAGIEAGLETFLVLTGVTDRAEADSYPYRPHRIVDSVAALIPEIEAAEERRRAGIATDGPEDGGVVDLDSSR